MELAGGLTAMERVVTPAGPAVVLMRTEDKDSPSGMEKPAVPSALSSSLWLPAVSPAGLLVGRAEFSERSRPAEES